MSRLQSHVHARPTCRPGNGRRITVALRLALLAAALAAAPGAVSARAHDAASAALEKIGFDQRLGEQVPMDLTFRDEAGRPVSLRAAAAGKPAVLVLLYYKCTMLCPLILDGLARTVKEVGFAPGREFAILTVSISPRETPEQAAARKTAILARADRPAAAGAWHFLTGEAPAIQALTAAVGFRYQYDPKQDEYAHAAGLVLLTPGGRIARYIYGMDYTARDLRLGLVEAAEGRIGSPVDQILLRCYRYDPVTGRYTFAIVSVVRLTGVATVLALGAFIVLMLLRERRARLQTREAR
ncbi:MAG: SCO family protein [Candidatus Methylomirabilales bacterium]